MITLEFEVGHIVSAGIVLLFIIGIVWYNVDGAIDNAKRRAKADLRNDLVTLDPTLQHLAYKRVLTRNYETIDTFDIDEVHRLANLQRNRNQHNKDYSDLNDAKKRLSDARKEK